MGEMFVLQFIFEKCSHIGLKFCQFECEALLLTVTKKKLCHLKNFRPRYDPTSSRACRELSQNIHVASCHTARHEQSSPAQQVVLVGFDVPLIEKYKPRL